MCKWYEPGKINRKYEKSFICKRRETFKEQSWDAYFRLALLNKCFFLRLNLQCFLNKFQIIFLSQNFVCFLRKYLSIFFWPNSGLRFGWKKNYDKFLLSTLDKNANFVNFESCYQAGCFTLCSRFSIVLSSA